LPPNALVAVSKGMRAVKLCTNKILQFLTEETANTCIMACKRGGWVGWFCHQSYRKDMLRVPGLLTDSAHTFNHLSVCQVCITERLWENGCSQLTDESPDQVAIHVSIKHRKRQPPILSNRTDRYFARHVTVSSRIKVCLQRAIWTELDWTDLQQVGPVTRRVHWARASTSLLGVCG